VPTGWTIDAAEPDGVRFVIGMRWGALWRLARRPWVARAFVDMLRAEPEAGLLRTRFGVRTAGPVVIQRWRSAEELHRWARDRQQAHAEPWRRFRAAYGGTAAWGVWHEVSGAAFSAPAASAPPTA
jgi:hypothetical protein